MAASQLITLGIGTPGDIPRFLTFGLFGAPLEGREPGVLELVASFSGPLQLSGSASGAVTLDAAFSRGIDLVGTVES